ncbi:hypothetical protein GCM10028807_10310 [Spirosoma daeguense]
MADTHAKRFRWWIELEPQWRAAFQYAFFRHVDQPSAEELENLWQTTVLRFAGPKAPNPNMSFELTNCSGVSGMVNLEILVITNQQLKNLNELTSLVHLKSLFVNNNSIQSLEGIKSLKKLEQLYAQINMIDSIEPVSELHNLREIYVSLNALKNLNGISKKHSKNLKAFFCLPNEYLPDREIIRVERNLGIRCRSI